MATFTDGRGTAGNVAVEQITKAARVTIAPRGFAYSVSGITATMAAALGAGAAMFTMKCDPGTSKRIFIERLRIQYTTIVAYTVPITISRRLHLVRSTTSTAIPAGGAAIVPVPKNALHTDSECSTLGGGDTRIATTAALTITGTTFDANVLRTLLLVHVGAAGAHHESIWEFNSSESAPIILEPGQVLGLVAGAAFDAAGTWQAAINVDWHEAHLWDATTSE